ncbi:unnamed protein product [Dovyalis caffra]|uniref:FPL domain-containing protein n=1 Tax=Dovyalis caffra TaxID=77055 RepID=A0AAV1S0W0_9ROSI|nr:unnamed protein product [Dovyalis caffra]
MPRMHSARDGFKDDFVRMFGGGIIPSYVLLQNYDMTASFVIPEDALIPNFPKYVIKELQKVKVVDMHNGELVVDLLQSIVEIVTYGDRQDPQIFECFMEHQVLAEFVRVIKISKNSKIEAPLLQYLSIMIQNMESEHAISCKDAVVSFPLYSEALKFAQHGEKMIQTAVRAVTLNIYNVCDDMVYQFITTPPVSKYFSDLVHSLKEQCIHLDNVVHASEEMDFNQRRKELLLETDRIVDDLYYLKDILCVGESRLCKVVAQNVLNLLVFPILLPLLQLTQSDSAFAFFRKHVQTCLLDLGSMKYLRLGSLAHSFSLYAICITAKKTEAKSSEKELPPGSNLSPITSLYIVSRLIQVIGGESIVNYVAGVLLYPYMSSSVRDAWEAHSSSAFFNHLNGMEKLPCSISESEGAESVNWNPLHGHLQDEPPITVQIKWHTGWFLGELLVLKGIKLDEHNFHLFNTSYERSCKCVQKELDGFWFDHIMDALRNEWASCKTALEEPSQSKDPLFLLELAICQIADGDATSSHVAWQRMVDAVKVFILHLQLKAFISKGEFLEKSFLDSIVILPFDSAKNLASGLSFASFGSEVSIGSGIPCRIAFSNAGIRDIYLIPVARGMSGKLLLVEKHPFRSQRGLVIAIAPLAGLSPKIDKDQPTWLHLRIREFEPRLNVGKNRSYKSKAFNQVADGRWTIGFPNAKACDAAQSAVLEETSKQRSSVDTPRSKPPQEKKVKLREVFDNLINRINSLLVLKENTYGQHGMSE